MAAAETHTLSSRGTLVFTNYRLLYRYCSVAVIAAACVLRRLNSSRVLMPRRDYQQGTSNDCSCDVPWFSLQRAMVTNKGRLRFVCKVSPPESPASLRRRGCAARCSQDYRVLEFGFDARTEWVEGLLVCPILFAVFEGGGPADSRLASAAQKPWINPFAFPGNQTKAFAFTHKMATTGINGWNLYNPVRVASGSACSLVVDRSFARARSPLAALALRS